MTYTFGDTDEASRRLRRLAEIYETEARVFLEQAAGEARTFQLATDLGCGPGWSTWLLDTVLHPNKTIGLDASERYVAEARANHPALKFFTHDVLQVPFPVASPDFLFCRFLLTHLSSPQQALHTWAMLAAPRALLMIHETERLESTDPALCRYYELVDQMQRYYGQALNVGALLDASFAETGWRIRQSEHLVLKKSAREMAQLHLPNLRTWGRNEYAVQAFNRSELDELEAALYRIAEGSTEAGIVHNTARQIIAERL
jgi:ubiquinone/menaquinone biosynthesis C-methylase UbiE